MRLVNVVAALLFVAASLAGCSGATKGNDQPNPPIVFDPATLSQATLAVLPPEEVWVTASDGKRMNNVVYRPDTTDPVGVYINFSPYWSDSAMEEGDAFSTYMIHEYVPRGFAVVLSAVRGTGHSEGCFEVGSDRESEDVYDVVDFFSKQTWSNGNIAAGGKSYDSTSQNGMVAKFPHPALKGLFHVSGITDMYSYTFRMGTPARIDSGVFTWEYAASQGLSEYAGGAGAGGNAMDEDPESLARIVDDAACVELPLGAANAEASTVSGVRTPYWVERDWTRTIGQSTWNGSYFFVHGLQDWNVQPSHIMPFVANLPAGVQAKTLGWLHQWQQQGTGHVYPMRTDWNETMLRWMDHILKGKDTMMDQLWGWEIQGTDMQWRRSAAWPPTTTMELDAFGKAGATKDIPLTPPGEADNESTRISGVVTIKVTATSMTADPVITAILYDQAPGAQRVWVGEAVLRGILRNSLETPAAVTPGQATEYTLQSYPLDVILAPGHTLGIELGGEPRESLVLPQQMQVTYLEGKATLPLGDIALVDPQPEPMKCFTC